MFMQHQGPLPAQARLDSVPNYRVQELQRARIYIYIYIYIYICKCTEVNPYFPSWGGMSIHMGATPEK